MKKTLLLLLTLVFGGNFAFSQEENNLKNFRFGLKVAPALTWYKPDASSKNFNKGGSSLKLQYGLITEFRLNKVASFVTGFEVAYDGGKLTVASPSTSATPNFYYLSKDGNLIEREDTAGQNYTPYQLFGRTYKTTYLTLPIALKLKTNEIGMLTYFGQIGVNTSIRLKNHVDDDVVQGTNSVAFGPVFAANSPHTTNSNLDNTKDMQLLKFALNLGLGAEYNLSGSTSLVFGINYHQGFSNVVKGESRYLFGSSSNNYNAIKQDIKSSAIVLTLGVLF
jgi:hypothetical protein